MSRIRSVHPGLWTDVEFVSLSPFARLLFIGIWNECDDKGVFVCSPLQLKMRLLPADNIDAAELLREISEAGLISRYEWDGKSYAGVKNFAKFQRPKKPNDIHPAPQAVLAFCGHDGEPAHAEPHEVRNQFPTSGEKSPQMEEGGGNGYSEANASGDAVLNLFPTDEKIPVPAPPAAPTAADVKRALFDTGVALIVAAGGTDRNARSLIGRWRKEYSDSAVLDALSRCQVEQPSQPIEWITKSLQAERNRQHGQSNPIRPTQSPTANAVQRAIAAGRGTPPCRADGQGGRHGRIGPVPDPVRAIGHERG